MNKYHQLEKIKAPKTPIALAIGSFDGVHRGHQHLINMMHSLAPTVAIFTFENHPSHILPSREPIPLIQTPSQKAHCLETYGVDLLIMLPFTLDLASLSYDQFLTTLHTHLPFTHLLFGEGATLGKNRAGTAEKVSALGQRLGYATHYIEKLPSISSGVIRKAIQKGAIEEAVNLLGHPFAIEGILDNGEFFPTKIPLCLPPPGEYYPHIQIATTTEKTLLQIVDNRFLLPHQTEKKSPVELIWHLERG